MTDWRDWLIWWSVSLFAGATVVGGKIAAALYRLAPEEPADPELAKHWRRRRRWMAVAEVAALPSFATAGVAITAHQMMPPVASVLITMVLGAIGFTLLLDAVQWLFRSRTGIPQPVAPQTVAREKDNA